MNIGIFTDTYEPQINGVVTSIKTAVEYLEKSNNVYIFCPNSKPKLESTPQVKRFSSFVYPFQKEYRLVLPYNKQYKEIETLNLDIIHVHTPFTMGYIGIRYAKKLGIPVVHTYHTYFEKYLHYFPILPKKWMYKYAKKESERFCNQCDLIIVPTNEMKEQIQSYDIKKDVTILPSGISVLPEKNLSVSTFKTTYFKDNLINALFVGRVGKEKNIYFLIDAFKKVLIKYKNIQLTIIGDGPERENLQRKINASKMLRDNVKFTGYLEKKDVFAAYYAADVMLFPSKSETQGLTAVESIMCGTPVIGINEMGVKNVIKSDVSGILTNDNSNEYVAAIFRYLESKDFQNNLSKNAIIEGKKYSYLKTTKALEDIYKGLIK